MRFVDTVDLELFDC